jgi:hypothetical protein
MRDVLYSLRQFAKAPGFAFLAVLCLGLGIGVNASIFSVLNSLFLRPMPVVAPDRLVVLSRGGGPLLSYPDFRDFRDRAVTLEGMAAALATESSLDFDGIAHSAGAEAVSLDYPSVVGVRPFLGRWFQGEVISYRAWQRFFDGAPDILGKRVRSETLWYTVVGVAPKEFEGTYLPKSMDLWVDQSYWQVRWEVSVLSAFASLALVLSAVGLYGMISYHVTLRRREIGIRMTIGARSADVFRLILRQGLSVTLIGIAIGLALSAAIARLMAKLLYGVSPTDPMTYAAVATLWLLVASAACYFPARRAANVDPTESLRHE